MKIRKLLVSALCATLIPVASIRAEPQNWLPEGSRTEAAGPPPAEYLTKGAKLEGLALLGKLLFNSPSLLGEKAVRIGLSCNSCHPNGHVNTSFYISGLSDEPGRIDLTNRFWRKGTEDHIFNPIPIPSLRNVSKTAPYGQDLNLPSLVAFTRHVIVDEFDGPEPSSADMRALIRYMELLANETGSNMPVQAHTATVPMLLKMLEEPLVSGKPDNYNRMAFLIREELGRRSTATTPFLKETADLLGKIGRELIKKKGTAKATFDTLMAKITNPKHQNTNFK